MKLILIRHAKSAWDDPMLSDHERVLNDRGRRSAVAIGQWLAREGHVPDQVLSSDSARTRETWDRMAPAFAQAPQPDWHRALYHAPAQALLDALHGATGQTVLLLGHNPGIGQFATMILTRGVAHPRLRDYPTAATLVAEVPSWEDLDWGQAEPLDFVVPRDLGVD